LVAGDEDGEGADDEDGEVERERKVDRMVGRRVLSVLRQSVWGGDSWWRGRRGMGKG
jgi:hypothetical protein